MAHHPDGQGNGDAQRVEVALAVPVGRFTSLTYAVPRELAAEIRPGSCVEVPLGSRRVAGIVTGAAVGEPPAGLRTLAAAPSGLTIPADLMETVRFAARYYGAPLSSFLRALLPSAVRRSSRKRIRPASDVLDTRGATLARSPLEARILERLSSAGLDLAVLGQELGPGVPAAVRGLVARGVLLVEDVSIERRGSSGSVRMTHCAGDVSGLRRAPRQRAVLEFVAARAPHPVPLAELGERFPGGRRLAESLITRGLIERSEDPARAAAPPAAPGETASSSGVGMISLSAEQEAALAAIDAAPGTFTPLLLFGVTGSGKTEVYLRATARALDRGKGVLLLVPEIGLTHQLVVEATRRFAGRIAVLHSGLSDLERDAAWSDLARGRRRVAIGARSALFAPIEGLGLVVVDEEHDPAYKQDESPRYHARDLAIVRAKHAGCPVVLASATPSLESFQAALSGRYQLVELRARANRAPMPQVEIVDLRAERWAPDAPAGDARASGSGTHAQGSPEQGGPGGPPRILSRSLEAALGDTYRSGEQSVLFLNRRGFARFLQCEACGRVESCPECSVSLTVHRTRRVALCHHCGHAEPPRTLCPECSTPLRARSFGTEQVEHAVRTLLPSARIARLDRDTTAHPALLRSTLASWRTGELDILVGTQMVAKGHDAPGVTLIGVILADASLNFPDFRAAERTFQLLAQVAGRAGRGAKPGRVIIQTRQPEHASLLAARRHDFAAFAEAELRSRRELGYPPFGRLTRIVLDGEGAAVESAAAKVAARLRGAVETRSVGAAAASPLAAPTVTILGPAPAPIERLRGRDRHQILIKARDVAAMRRVLEASRLGEVLDRRGGARLVVDVDPIAML